MRHSFDRRDFLRVGAAVGAGLGLAGLADSPHAEEPGGHATVRGGTLTVNLPPAAPHAEKLGWRLGCQAYTFNHFTFFQAIEKTALLGLHYIEAYPGQRVSSTIAAGVDESLANETRRDIKKKLGDWNVKLVNFGVCSLTKDGARKTFDFAKDMGIETLVSEPAEGDVAALDKLCEEYKIHIAIHDHPKPAPYWNPDTVLKVCQGRGRWIGACADTGHWMRSGLNPIECVKKLEGRIVSFHFKDLNQAGPDAHDVPWGTGICDVKGMLTEIHRQKLKAVFSIEYEYHWDNSLPEIAQSVAYFDKVAAELAGA
jgi:sugar phosphate isomerase/epimerase